MNRKPNTFTRVQKVFLKSYLISWKFHSHSEFHNGIPEKVKSKENNNKKKTCTDDYGLEYEGGIKIRRCIHCKDKTRAVKQKATGKQMIAVKP